MSQSDRIASLDQFRGYTMAAMFLVNFIGAYAAVHPLFKHPKIYCSYADTVMPQFFFIVGFAYRLTFLRRREALGPWEAYRRAIVRNLGLILLGAVVYQLDGQARSWDELRRLGVGGFLSTAFRSSVFQALVHIGVTCLWILPAIGKRPEVRVLALAASGLLHLLLSHLFYYEWALENHVIDGGPLGFMSWAIPTLAGSLAYDLLISRGPRRALRPMACYALLLMVLGYAFACLNAIGGSGGLAAYLVEPPFVPPSRAVNIWTMSQQTGSLSYMTFTAGLSLGLYAIAVGACDLRGWTLGFFRTFGRNALAGYLIHMVIAEFVQPYVPRDAPLWYVAAGFSIYAGITYLFLRSLERRGIFLRL